MRWIALLLSLQAVPAAWSASSVAARVTAPLPTGERSLVLKSRRGSLQAIWLHDGGRDHLAFRDLLGAPVAVVRSDGTRVGLELRGRPEVVSHADAALHVLSGGQLALPDAARLLAGRLPPGTTLTRVWGGWRARRGALEAGLALDGTLLWARHPGVRLDGARLVLLGQRFELQVGPVQPRPIPGSAFAVGARRSVPIERVVEAAL